MSALPSALRLIKENLKPLVFLLILGAAAMQLSALIFLLFNIQNSSIKLPNPNKILSGNFDSAQETEKKQSRLSEKDLKNLENFFGIQKTAPPKPPLKTTLHNYQKTADPAPEFKLQYLGSIKTQSGQTYFFLRAPQSPRPVKLGIDESIGGWTLITVNTGKLIFKHKKGAIHELKY